jgi:hypothetical protein
MKNVSSILVLSLAGSLMSPFLSRAADDRVSQYAPKLLKFSAAKEQQVRMMATNLNISVPTEIRDFFNAAQNGDYAVVTNTIERLGPVYVASYHNPGGKLPEWIRKGRTQKRKPDSFLTCSTRPRLPGEPQSGEGQTPEV